MDPDGAATVLGQTTRIVGCNVDAAAFGAVVVVAEAGVRVDARCVGKEGEGEEGEGGGDGRHCWVTLLRLEMMVLMFFGVFGAGLRTVVGQQRRRKDRALYSVRAVTFRRLAVYHDRLGPQVVYTAYDTAYRRGRARNSFSWPTVPRSNTAESIGARTVGGEASCAIWLNNGGMNPRYGLAGIILARDTGW